MSDQALIEDQKRLTESRRAQAAQAEEAARKAAPAQSPGDFIGTAKHSGAEIPVKQVIPVPARK